MLKVVIRQRLLCAKSGHLWLFAGSKLFECLLCAKSGRSEDCLIEKKWQSFERGAEFNVSIFTTVHIYRSSTRWTTWAKQRAGIVESHKEPQMGKLIQLDRETVKTAHLKLANLLKKDKAWPLELKRMDKDFKDENKRRDAEYASKKKREF